MELSFLVKPEQYFLSQTRDNFHCLTMGGVPDFGDQLLIKSQGFREQPAFLGDYFLPQLTQLRFSEIQIFESLLKYVPRCLGPSLLLHLSQDFEPISKNQWKLDACTLKGPSEYNRLGVLTNLTGPICSSALGNIGNNYFRFDQSSINVQDFQAFNYPSNFEGLSLVSIYS